MNNDNYYLKICSECRNVSVEIWNKIKAHKTDLEKLQVDLQSSKLAISPEILSSKFSSEIIISN